MQLDWDISSAGTHARPGLDMHPNTRRLLRSRTINCDGWRTRTLDQIDLSDQDLILVATRSHRSFIVTRRPELLDRTYPIRQFGQLAEHARARGTWQPDTADGSLLDAIHTVQGEVSTIPDEVDLADPIGQPYRKFRACAATIDDAVHRIIG